MQPNAKNRWQFRALKLALVFVSIAIGFAIILKVFNENIVYFYSPSELPKNTKPNTKLRLGGIVKDGSLKQENDHWVFIIVDETTEQKVIYKGILPNLFRENQATIATGYVEGPVFVAKELLAKHDENYMPKEIAENINIRN